MIKEIFEHRSIRDYKSTPIETSILERILEAGIRASNTGNMQVYSMVVTTSSQIKEKLSPCHFSQPMVTKAPVVITFCADIRRFSLWCKVNGAQPHYDNFVWFINGVIDTILASGNVALAAEAEGLGVCYLGTTTYNADKISQILQLPLGVIPVTTLVMGYPNSIPAITDRLPLEAVVHYDTYKDYSEEDVKRLWSQREASSQTQELLRVNDLPNLAQIFTMKRYKANDNLTFSRKYFETLKVQGFFNQ